MSRLSCPLLFAAATATALAMASHTASAFIAPGGSYATPSLATRRRRNTLASLQMAVESSLLHQKDGVARTTALQASAVAEVETASDVTTTDTKTAWNDDGFVFGLEGSGLERPKGRTASVVVEGDSLENQPHQVAFVAGTLMSHAIFCGVAVAGMYHANLDNAVLTAVQTVLLTVMSWVLADFGSGVLHFSVDNYGNGRTPIMGGIIAAFQGHHSAPWTITQRGFFNNVSKLCVPFGVVPVALVAAITGPAVTFFLTTFCVFEIMSQEFHKWSHQRPSETPAWVNWMQKVGLTVGRKGHAQHHVAPYDGNYCIVSGVCNQALDQSGFFRRLEHVIYQKNGVESNAWKLDPELRERTLRGDYRL
jgi:hypothetical protein